MQVHGRATLVKPMVVEGQIINQPDGAGSCLMTILAGHGEGASFTVATNAVLTLLAAGAKAH
jgi:hypothetical protein